MATETKRDERDEELSLLRKLVLQNSEVIKNMNVFKGKKMSLINENKGSEQHQERVGVCQEDSRRDV